MKSDIDVKDDIYNYLKGGELVKEVSGGLYKRKRPKDSVAEDITIFIGASSVYKSNQYYYVNVNIYVADDLVNNQYEEQTSRLRLLCQKAMSELGSHCGGDYYFTLEEQSVHEVEERNEHVIYNRLYYRTNNE